VDIQFIEYSDSIGYLESTPRPASKYVPTWYKKAPIVTGEHKIKNCPFSGSGAPNTTYKNCTPFLDALTAGYIFEAPIDIQFKLNENNTIEWNHRLPKESGNFLSIHSFEQYEGLPNLNNVYELPLVFKWGTGYSIKTPPGYSTLYTHPFNRYELPFRVMTGIVDTDKYHNEVFFPFQITYKFKDKDDILIVEKGTPLCQILPFKRENWQSKAIKFNKDLNTKTKILYFSKIINAYKSRYWSKKNYE